MLCFVALASITVNTDYIVSLHPNPRDDTQTYVVLSAGKREGVWVDKPMADVRADIEKCHNKLRLVTDASYFERRGTRGCRDGRILVPADGTGGVSECRYPDQAPSPGTVGYRRFAYDHERQFGHLPDGRGYRGHCSQEVR